MNLYSPPYCLDILIQIIKVQYVGEKYIKAKVAYLNKNTLAVYEQETIKIPIEAYRSWKKL